MTLLEAIIVWNRNKHNWPEGFNFKNKSKFVGISLNDICITQEMLDSKEWSIELESRDKEFNKMLGEL